MDKLSLNEEIPHSWATVICLSSHNYRIERDGRDSDKAPLATSTTTVESEGIVAFCSNNKLSHN